ncbi:MAG TPA: hypothetical protein VLT36_00535 [Candidatus Dormibacteraeota bacterium]|nr:hypothetical protein [Candidatus Dormibacteraeota bacterium]
MRKVLRLVPTGRHGTFPEFRFSGAILPTGWYLVCLWRHEFSDAELRPLSEGDEVVACFVEEHVMVSKAAGWKDGRETWAVAHEAEKNLKHLDVRGAPPPQFARIRDELFAQQTPDTCDYIFDIPVSLAADLVDFRYDERPDVDFEILERPSLLRRIFG